MCRKRGQSARPPALQVIAISQKHRFVASRACVWKGRRSETNADQLNIGWRHRRNAATESSAGGGRGKSVQPRSFGAGIDNKEEAAPASVQNTMR